jgi:hypothetical protein
MPRRDGYFRDSLGRLRSPQVGAVENSSSRKSALDYASLDWIPRTAASRDTVASCAVPRRATGVPAACTRVAAATSRRGPCLHRSCERHQRFPGPLSARCRCEPVPARLRLARPVSLHACRARAISRPSVATASRSHRPSRRASRAGAGRLSDRGRRRRDRGDPRASGQGAAAAACPVPWSDRNPGQLRDDAPTGPAILRGDGRGRAPPGRRDDTPGAVSSWSRSGAQGRPNHRRSSVRRRPRHRALRGSDPVPRSRPAVAGVKGRASDGRGAGCSCRRSCRHRRPCDRRRSRRWLNRSYHRRKGGALASRSRESRETAGSLDS